MSDVAVSLSSSSSSVSSAGTEENYNAIKSLRLPVPSTEAQPVPPANITPGAVLLPTPGAARLTASTNASPLQQPVGSLHSSSSATALLPPPGNAGAGAVVLEASAKRTSSGSINKEGSNGNNKNNNSSSTLSSGSGIKKSSSLLNSNLPLMPPPFVPPVPVPPPPPSLPSENTLIAASATTVPSVPVAPTLSHSSSSTHGVPPPIPPQLAVTPPALAAAPVSAMAAGDKDPLESSASSVVSMHRVDALPPLVPTLRPQPIQYPAVSSGAPIGPVGNEENQAANQNEAVTKHTKSVFESKRIQMFSNSSSSSSSVSSPPVSPRGREPGVAFSGALRFPIDEEAAQRERLAVQREDQYGVDERFIPKDYELIAQQQDKQQQEKQQQQQQRDASSQSTNALTPDQQKDDRRHKHGRSARSRDEHHRKRSDAKKQATESRKKLFRDPEPSAHVLRSSSNTSAGRASAPSVKPFSIPALSAHAGPIVPLLNGLGPFAAKERDAEYTPLQYRLRNPSLDPMARPGSSVSGRQLLHDSSLRSNTISGTGTGYYIPTGAFSEAGDTSNVGASGSSAAAGPEIVEISVCVRGISSMHADVGVTHPFVRVWALNCVTGANLIAGEARFGLSHPFDFRCHHTRVPCWDAELIIPLDASRVQFAEKQTVLLFEVLDCGNENILGFYVPRPGIYPICWGYYMLHDCFGQPNVTSRIQTVDIQMFPYPSREPWYYFLIRLFTPLPYRADAYFAPSDARLDYTGVLDPSGSQQAGQRRRPGPQQAAYDAPSIFDIFRSHVNRSIRYEACLTVSLKLPSSRRPIRVVSTAENILPYEAFLLDTLKVGFGACITPRRGSAFFSAGFQTGRVRSKSRNRAKSRRAMSVTNDAALACDYYRVKDALPPTTLLQTIVVHGVVTCVAFSHRGDEISLGVSRNLQHIIERRVSREPEAPVISTLVGHVGHIHKVVYSADDSLMLSCSSDKTVRVWRASSMGGDTVECLCTLPHSYPVYCALFHNDHIVTGGYDSRILTWRCSGAIASGSSMGSSPFLEALIRRSFVSPDGSFATRNQTSGVPATPEQVSTGELVYQVSIDTDDEKSFVLCLASKEDSTRLWSLNSKNKLRCWRALNEQHGNRTVWQMTPLRQQPTLDESIADVQVRDKTVLVIPQRSPLVYVFDAASCKQLLKINMVRVPSRCSFYLLPDGRSFMLLNSSGVYHLWDCFDAALCTPTDGFRGTKMPFTVEKVASATSQNLFAYVSAAPCPESQVFAALQCPEGGPPVAVVGVGGDDESSASEEKLELPVEVTVVSILGTTAPPVDTDASTVLCKLLGGDVRMKLSAAARAMRRRETAQRLEEAENKKQRLKEMIDMNREKSAFAEEGGGSGRGGGGGGGGAVGIGFRTTPAEESGSRANYVAVPALPLSNIVNIPPAAAATSVTAGAAAPVTAMGTDPALLDVYESYSRINTITDFWNGFVERIGAIRRSRKNRSEQNGNVEEDEEGNELP